MAYAALEAMDRSRYDVGSSGSAGALIQFEDTSREQLNCSEKRHATVTYRRRKRTALVVELFVEFQH